MQKWECPCGYIYDPEEGDYENGVEPGTPWEKVPADWVCPKCDRWVIKIAFTSSAGERISWDPGLLEASPAAISSLQPSNTSHQRRKHSLSGLKPGI